MLKVSASYSSVPNRRVGRNKRACGKILKNNKRAGQNIRVGGKFSGKSINVQTKIKPCRAEFFSKSIPSCTFIGSGMFKFHS